MENFDFKKIKTSYKQKKIEEAIPISGVQENINIKKFSHFESIPVDITESIIENYKKNKNIFHEGGSMAKIYELKFDNNEVIVKEMRNYSEIQNGILINRTEEEFNIQDDLYNLGIKVPAPVSVIEITTIDFKNKKINKDELIIMEKINGLSVGDYYRKVKNGADSNLSENFSVVEFMDKLRKEINKMHKHNYFHRDLTINNVMIDEHNNPVIIDFGASINTTGGFNPYELSSTVMIKNGKRVLLEGSPRLVDDEKNLNSIEQILKEILKF